MTSTTPRDLLDRLGGGYVLPSLSPVALKLIQLASDDACSVKDLALLIEKDPALVVRLLKLANSAFFRSGHPVATLSQAIVKVGFERLRIMALSVSLRQTFPLGKIGPFDYDKFWKVSTYRALICRALAAHLEGASPEEAYVSGLLMEIGLPIFFDLFVRGVEEEARLELEPLEVLLEWERKSHGIDHRQIGEAALEYWKFPTQIIASQKIYAGAPESVPPLPRLCGLARSFSGVLFYHTGEFQSIFEEAEKAFGLNSSVVNDVLVNTFDQVLDMAEALNLGIDKEADLMEVMDKANRSLGRLSENVSELSKPDRECLPSFGSLDEREEAVSQTLQAVAHEIRNPLLAVGGFARRLASSLDPVSPGGKYVRIILEETARLEAALSEMTGSATEPKGL